MPENKNDSQNSNSSVTSKIKIPKIICNPRCSICGSDYLKEIHDLRKLGKNYDEIVLALKPKFETSPASLSRHFKNYTHQKTLISSQLINHDLIAEATQQAAHTKKLVELINKAFDIIGKKIEAGTLSFDVGDLEKLMKLRYQVLSGQDADESDILAIFQKASDKYGLNINQGILFKPAKTKVLELPENEPVRT